MNNFLAELIQIFDKVLIWSKKFKKGDRNYDFDIDDELYSLSVKHDKDFKAGDLLLIYNLLDFYCDAVKHEFKQIDKDYSMSQARSDIESLSNILKNSSAVELPEDLKKRLEGI